MKKRCSKCHKHKDSTEFYNYPLNRDGLKGQCKECCKAYSKEWIKKNKEHYKKYRLRYSKTKKAKAIKKKSNIKYRSTKHGRNIARLVFNKYQKTAKGKEATLRATSKRRSIFKNEQQAFTLILEQWLQTLKYFKNRCAYCGKKSKKLVHEHVIPLQRGGWHTRENVIPACQKCNLLKGRKIPFLEWEPPKYFRKMCRN